MEYTTGFPAVNLFFSINPVAFTVWGWDIYWYGIILGLAGLVCVVFATVQAYHEDLELNGFINLLTFSIIFGLIGARAYFVLSNFESYSDFASMINVREGGIAIYGAIIAGFLTQYCFSKIYGLPFSRVLDVMAVTLPLGQIIGRFANFINQEAYGEVTDLPWRMMVTRGLQYPIYVHPTFLYEAIWNLIGFVFLMNYKKHKKFSGELCTLYVFWYGLGRAWIEQLRTDSLPYGADFKISQIVAAVSAIASAAYLYVKRRNLLLDSSHPRKEKPLV